MRKKAVGYQRRDPITHRRYDWGAAIKAYKKTKRFRYVKDGSGHKAGEEWADRKGIDPEATQTRYGKNSPSFDEGVYKSKQKRMAEKMKE